MKLLGLLPVLFLMPSSVMAIFGANNETDFWDDFANNFATDLAPVIALFGEQVTKQFLSESTTILDVIIFTVGPLGIITAVVSCIRVANSTFLKSIIGRAREPHGLPEVELCSSTSGDVCELWSNGGICRVFGRPRILEFMYNKPSNPSDYLPTIDHSGDEIPAKCGIESTREVFEKFKPTEPKQTSNPVGRWERVSSSQFLRLSFLPKSTRGHESPVNGGKHVEANGEPDVEGGTFQDGHGQATNPFLARRMDTKIGEQAEIDRNFAPYPNLALNIGGPRSSRAVMGLWAAAIFGILLQASFFSYAIWATRYKASFYDNTRVPSNPSWFILTVVGTAFIVIGMAMSAEVIDRISTERRFVFRGSTKPRMFWLQPAGQRIGDQEFEGFAYNQPKIDYITSWKTAQNTSDFQWRVWCAVMLSVVGWVIQFVGLRGVHGTVSLYQFVITIIMSIIRGCLRSYSTPPKKSAFCGGCYGA